MKNHYVIDIETLSNCFLMVAEHYKKDEVQVFTIGLLRNDLENLLVFLDHNANNDEWHVSFNGISFDAQVLQYIMLYRRKLRLLTGEQIAMQIYAEAQETIRRSRDREFPKYNEHDLFIKQIDVFKLNHWDNPAKRSSLSKIGEL